MDEVPYEDETVDDDVGHDASNKTILQKEETKERRVH